MTGYKGDLDTLPPNVHYFLLQREDTGVILKEHLANANSTPKDFLEEYKMINNCQELVPNMEGCYYDMDDILAKELSHMASMLKEKLTEYGILDMVSHVLNVKVNLKINRD